MPAAEILPFPVGAACMTRVLVVSDVLIYRLGIAHFLERDGRVEVAEAVGDADAAVRGAAATAPDVVLLDTTMPGYEAAAAAVAAVRPEARLVALTVPETEQAVVAAAAAGAVGYVTRDSSLDDLVAAIEGATRGEAILSPLMAGVLLRRAAGLRGEPARGEPPLTGRQREIGLLLGEGLSNKEIAARLCIEVTTVKNHVHQILEKLQLKRRSEVAAAISRDGARPGI